MKNTNISKAAVNGFWFRQDDAAELIEFAAAMSVATESDSHETRKARAKLRIDVLGACFMIADKAVHVGFVSNDDPNGPPRPYNAREWALEAVKRLQYFGDGDTTLDNVHDAVDMVHNGNTDEEKSAREALAYAVHAHECELGFFSGVCSDVATYALKSGVRADALVDIVREQIEWSAIENVWNLANAAKVAA